MKQLARKTRPFYVFGVAISVLLLSPASASANVKDACRSLEQAIPSWQKAPVLGVRPICKGMRLNGISKERQIDKLRKHCPQAMRTVGEDLIRGCIFPTYTPKCRAMLLDAIQEPVDLFTMPDLLSKEDYACVAQNSLNIDPVQFQVYEELYKVQEQFDGPSSLACKALEGLGVSCDLDMDPRKLMEREEPETPSSMDDNWSFSDYARKSKWPGVASREVAVTGVTILFDAPQESTLTDLDTDAQLQTSIFSLDALEGMVETCERGEFLTQVKSRRDLELATIWLHIKLKRRETGNRTPRPEGDVGKLAADMGLLETRDRYIPQNRFSLFTFTTRWINFCDAAQGALSVRQKQTQVAQTVCDGDVACEEDYAEIEGNAALKSVVECLLGDPNGEGRIYRENTGASEAALCMDAAAVLTYASNTRFPLPVDLASSNDFSHSGISTLLPLVQSTYFRSALAMEHAVEGCIVGNYRFVNDQYKACEKMETHLRLMSHNALFRGCEAGEQLEGAEFWHSQSICMTLIEASERRPLGAGPYLPLEDKLKLLEDGCLKTPDRCGSYVSRIPVDNSVCTSVFYDWEKDQAVYLDTKWRPLLPRVKEMLNHICDLPTGTGTGVKKACILLADAEADQGVFADCPSVRKQLQDVSERKTRCLEENAPSVLQYHLSCAGISAGTGNANDRACQMQALSVHCR